MVDKKSLPGAGMSRRDFLRVAGSAAGAAALSRFIPAAFAQDERIMRLVPPELLPKASSGGLPQSEIVVASMSGPDINAHIRNAPRFTEYTQGKVNVRFDEIGRTAFTQSFLTNMQAQSDVWDVIAIGGPHFLTGAPAGWWVPMSQLMDDPESFNAELYDIDDFILGSLDASSYQGTLYALPQHVSAQMTFYRADLLEKYDIESPDPAQGWSFDQVAEAGRKLKAGFEADGRDDISPIVILLAGPTITFDNFSRSMGAQVYDERGVPTYNVPEAVAAMEMIKAWLDEGIVSPGSIGYNYSEALETLRQEQTAIAFQWDTAAVELNDPGKSPVTANTLSYTVFPYEASVDPQAPRLVNAVWHNFIPVFSKNQEAALAYAAWYTSKEIAFDYLMFGGGHSGRSSLLNDPEILAAHRQYAAMLANFEGLAPANPLPQIGFLNSDILGPNLQAFFTGEVETAQEALDKAQEEATRYLQDEGVL